MTFSIVAHDRESGSLGVAVQSCYLAVGATVPWIRSGVGVVATQALVEPSYGPALLSELQAGRHPGAALTKLLDRDDAAGQRQVAALSVNGQSVVHSGAGCLPYVEEQIGDGVIAVGNLLTAAGTASAMTAAFESAQGDLADRLIAALVAGQENGGDLRGTQSAAILVATEDETYPTVNLRVDDHPEPIAELTRLLDLHRSYRLLGDGVNALMAGPGVDAAPLLTAARLRQPSNEQFAFWAEVAAGSSPAHLGRRWAELEERLASTRHLRSSENAADAAATEPAE